MAPDANADEQKLVVFGQALADAVAEALPAWVESSVRRVATAHTGALDEQTERAAREAAREAAADVVPALRALLTSDLDAQATTPLALLRGAVVYPTRVLHAAGVPPVRRDAVAVHQFPHDDYDLTPMAFADLGPAVHEAGLAWGAAKAHVFKARRRAEGRS